MQWGKKEFNLLKLSLMKESPSFIPSVHCRRKSELETWQRIVNTLSQVLEREHEKPNHGKGRKSYITRINLRVGLWVASAAFAHIFLEYVELMLKHFAYIMLILHSQGIIRVHQVS